MATTIYAHVSPTDGIEVKAFPESTNPFVSVEIACGDANVCLMVGGTKDEQLTILYRMRNVVLEAIELVEPLGDYPTDTPLGLEDDKAGEE